MFELKLKEMYNLKESKSIRDFQVEDHNGGNFPLKAGSKSQFFTMKHEDGKSEMEEMELGIRLSRINITADGKINNRQLYAQIEKGYKVAGYEYDDEHGGFLFHLIKKDADLADVIAAIDGTKETLEKQANEMALIKDVYIPDYFNLDMPLLGTDDGEYPVNLGHYKAWKIQQPTMKAKIVNGKIDIASVLAVLPFGYGQQDDHRCLSDVYFNAPAKTIMLDFDS